MPLLKYGIQIQLEWHILHGLYTDSHPMVNNILFQLRSIYAADKRIGYRIRIKPTATKD